MPDAAVIDLPKTDWIALADQVGHEIAATTARHDEEDSFVEEGFRALKAAGFFKALVPAELGGRGADYRDICSAIRRLGTYCGSTALAFSMHSHLVAVPAWRWRHEKAPVEGLLKRVAAEDLILISSGAADWLPSNGRAMKVEGGYRVTAKKIFASACQMGDLLVTSARHEDAAGGPEVLHFAVPFKAEGVRRLDTWRVLGMRGTGSHDVVLEDVFVPDAAIVARREPGKWHMLYHHVFALAFPLVFAAYLGVAEGARARALEIARAKPKTSALVTATGRLENAFMKAEIAHEQMIRIAETEAAGPERTSRAGIAHTLTAQAAVETVERAMDVVGGSSFYRDLGLERAFRDVQGARFHQMQELPQLELSGRLALGMGIDG
ncbi:acyl-CoA dehydrogenase family protein [Roseomonas fluvialis]|uniref:Acyl-CoA dehydrogenase n=1 Tax=Roseomonas fluvialis TaxID=1750527 RepID=A0ABN6NZ63_9PROT|nr:acyl-CoA dehydrogenase family protein [Roseomonas fluvialis]BDG71331.1 acyl-CoA dehydrogenase [Roseomonas fluvialis]